MLEALNRHANAALLAGQVPMSPNATALWERCIAVMLDSGFRSRLPRVYATVACYVMGFALQFSARGVSKEHPATCCDQPSSVPQTCPCSRPRRGR
jgi:TetR/AcrR family tetracycline transcriptional repressor